MKQGKMYQFQESLGKLPLPRLEDTCELYLQMVTPLLTETELAQTTAAVINFQQGIGKRLQKQLEMLDRSTSTSYLHEFMEDSYLEYRLPLPVNKNPALLASPVLATSKLSFARFAATIISNTLRFYLKIKRRELAPDIDIYRQRSNPLCMVQYDNLFGTSRIPGIKRDSFRRTENSEHVVVIRRNVFYALHLLKGEKLPTVEQIEQQLDWILANTPLGEPAVGALTGLPRTHWSVVRSYMSNLSPMNARSLELLDTALFIVCLDEKTPTGLESTLSNAFHGDGRNRWFDKSIQLIFTPNGQWAINMEHTGHDAYPMMRFLSEVNRELEDQNSSPIPCELPMRLQWNLSEGLLEEIEQASATVDSLIAQHEVRVLEFNEFGSDWLAQRGLVADAVLQIAIQLAYVRLHKQITCISEVVHTRNFQYGRFETTRTVTPESLELIKTFSETTSDQTRYSLLKRAVGAHLWRLFDCKKGNYVQRHLFALHTLARSQGVTADIFQDKVYTEVFCQPVVCTSSFPPGMGCEVSCSILLVSHGYTVVYRIDRERIVLSVMSKNRLAGDFIEFLKRSLLQLRSILLNYKP
jgi:hypothetical protein